MFIRGPDGFDSLNKKNDKQFCDTAPLGISSEYLLNRLLQLFIYFAVMLRKKENWEYL